MFVFPDAVYSWGISVIAWVQSWSLPFFIPFMKLVSILGDVPFYALILAIVFWAWDKKRGFRLGAVLLFAACCNSIIKNILQVPRPFVRAPEIKIGDADGFSTPSGHSQMAAVFWPLFSRHFAAKKYCLAVCIVIAVAPPLIIGLSRIALGVHYPTDVFLGWGVGLIIFFLSEFFWNYFSPLIAPLRASIKNLLAALLCGGLIMTGFLEPSHAGIFFGLLSGYAVLCERCPFDALSGTITQKILRLGIGCVSLGVIYVLGKLASSFLTEQEALMDFIRYGLMGFFISYGGPRLFIALRLASAEENS